MGNGRRSTLSAGGPAAGLPRGLFRGDGVQVDSALSSSPVAVSDLQTIRAPPSGLPIPCHGATPGRPSLRFPLRCVPRRPAVSPASMHLAPAFPSKDDGPTAPVQLMDRRHSNGRLASSGRPSQPGAALGCAPGRPRGRSERPAPLASFTMTTKNGHTRRVGGQRGAVVVTLPRARRGRAGSPSSRWRLGAGA